MYHPTGFVLAIGTHEGFIHVVSTPSCPANLPPRECRRLWRGKTAQPGLVDVAFSPSGDSLVAGTREGVIFLYNMVLHTPTADLTALPFLKVGPLQVLDTTSLASGMELREIQFSDDCQVFATCHTGGTVRMMSSFFLHICLAVTILQINLQVRSD